MRMAFSDDQPLSTPGFSKGNPIVSRPSIWLPTFMLRLHPAPHNFKIVGSPEIWPIAGPP